MKILLIFLGICLILFIFFKMKSSFGKYRAALNALLAQYTYFKLSYSEQERVMSKIKEIMSSGSINADFVEERFNTLNDRELYGFMAIAMGELNISPAIQGYTWHFVRNPFVALLNADKEIAAAQIELEKKGIEVNL
jgi:hypothetical protein